MKKVPPTGTGGRCEQRLQPRISRECCVRGTSTWAGRHWADFLQEECGRWES